EIFAREGVRTHTWVAPAHSFDATTVALLPRFGIRVISDGYTRYPYVMPEGLLWVPQQLWERLQPRSSGVWTVCCHIDEWTARHVERFRRNLEQFAGQIISLAQIERAYGGRVRTWCDALQECWFRRKLH